MKYFRMSYDEILRKRSYQNIVLLNAAIPSFRKSDKTEQGRKQKRRFKGSHPNQFFEQFM